MMILKKIVVSFFVFDCDVFEVDFIYGFRWCECFVWFVVVVGVLVGVVGMVVGVSFFFFKFIEIFVVVVDKEIGEMDWVVVVQVLMFFESDVIIQVNFVVYVDD